MRRMYWVGEKRLTTKQILLEADFKAIQASKLAGRDVVLILLGCGCRPNELFNALLGKLPRRLFYRRQQDGSRHKG